MKHRQSFPVTIQITNPINFAIDANARALEYVTSEYTNKCYGGCFIVKIVEIAKRSLINIDNTNNKAEATMDVIFIADVVTFMAGEVLSSVTIKTAQFITGIYDSPESGRAAVAISAPTNAPYVAVNTKLPVRIMNTLHQPDSNLASIYAKLLTCDSEAAVYRLRGSLSLDQATKTECATRLAMIKAELDLRNTLLESKPKQKKLLFFEGLLYGYSARSLTSSLTSSLTAIKSSAGLDWQGPDRLKRDYEDSAERNLLDLVSKYLTTGESVSVSGEWTRPLSVYRSSPIVTISPPGTHANAVEGEPGLIIGLYLKNILDFLVATRELVEVYEITENSSVWDAMRQAQQKI